MLLGYDLHEVARYMGYKHGAQPCEILCELIDEAHKELCEIITPEYIYKEYDFVKAECGIIIDGIQFRSKKLLEYMRNSTSVILFGATLGQGADVLIRKYSDEDIAMAAIIQAVASSMTEKYCDLSCVEIKSIIKTEQRPRFSPGYGDLNVSAQADFFKLLPMKEKLGISLSDGFMMTPTKKVTAFIAIK